jgi:hypothetical protein
MNIDDCWALHHKIHAQRKDMHSIYTEIKTYKNLTKSILYSKTPAPRIEENAWEEKRGRGHPAVTL